MFLLPKLHFTWYNNYNFIVLVMNFFFLSISYQPYEMLLYCVNFYCLRKTSKMFFVTLRIKETQLVNIFIVNVIGCFISYKGGQPTMQCMHGWNISQAPHGYYYYYNSTTQGN